MTKFFIKETNEEVVFGDVVELTLTKELEDGYADRTVEMKVTEDTLEFLIENNIIEVRDTIEFCDNCGQCEGCIHEETIDELCEDQVKQESKIKELEKKFKDIQSTVTLIRQDVSEILNALTKPTSKKK